MKVLVTGAGGFLGKEICKQLIESSKGEVHGIGRNHYASLEELDMDQFKLDIRDPLAVNHFFEEQKYDAVIHVAAKAGVWGKFSDYYEINYRGTCNLINAALNTKVKYFVYTSTPSVVFGSKSLSGADETLPYPSKFLTDYAHTKTLAEKTVLAVDKEKMQTCALRPHLIYGPGDPHIEPRLLEMNRKGRLRIIGDGKNKVDVTHVSRAAEAHVKALKAMEKNPSLSNQAYFIGDEEPVVLWDFINSMVKKAGQKPVTKRIGQKLCYLLGGIFEFIYSFLPRSLEPPMTRFVCLQLSEDHYFSHEKAKRDLSL